MDSAPLLPHDDPHDDRHDDPHGDDDHDRGLQFDMSTLLARRRLLGLAAGAAGATLLAACGLPRTAGGSATTATTVSSGATTAGASGTLTETPEETGGPYPADGSNGVNVLTQSGIVRSDIRSSFGTSTTVAAGVPLTIRLTVVDEAGTPQAGAAVYLWHCDREGRYSLYTLPAENYLRGVQAAAADGTVTFSSIFPACYSGRWPHIHVEVYPSLDAATSASGKLLTSQLALPEDACATVYATSGYEQSVRNLAQTSLATDMVFGDGWDHELATVTGDTTDGFLATLTVVVV